MRTTIEQQIKVWLTTRSIMDYKGNVDDFSYGFVDWFCKDTTLQLRAKKLMPKVLGFLNSYQFIDRNKFNVIFNNNVDTDGMYDSFSLCDTITDEVVWYIVPKHSYDSSASIWHSSNDFATPIYTANSFEELDDLDIQSMILA